ncbi:hypothetical protein MUK42_35524, partial [Musa troglodytarum]
LFYCSLLFWLLYLSLLVGFLFVHSFRLLSSSLLFLFLTLNLGRRYETEKGTQIPPIPSFRAPEAAQLLKTCYEVVVSKGTVTLVMTQHYMKICFLIEIPTWLSFLMGFEYLKNEIVVLNEKLQTCKFAVRLDQTLEC